MTGIFDSLHSAAEPRGGRRESICARGLRLSREARGCSAQEITRVAIEDEFPGRIAALSSFGAEAAVTLHLISQVDPDFPVIFLDTDRHFAPTLTYRDQLVEWLGLTNVSVLKPAPEHAARHDRGGDLWRTDPDLCCDFRKVRPLEQIAGRYDAMITGRKRFHGGGRVRLPAFDAVNGQIRVNPLSAWSSPDVERYFAEHRLPRHPLVEGGFPSIGCWPCTKPAQSADVRSGRWEGSEKVECGIHVPTRYGA